MGNVINIGGSFNSGSPGGGGDGSLPAIQLRNIAGGQDLTATTYTIVEFPNIDFSDSQFSLAANRVTVNEDGRYDINSFVTAFDDITNNYRYKAQIAIFVNGTEAISTIDGYIRVSNTNYGTSIQIAYMLELVAGDIVDIRIRRISTPTGLAESFPNASSFGITKVG